MKMTGDLAVRRGGGGLVAEYQPADGERFHGLAGDTGRRVGIVIAGDPDPVAPDLKRREQRAIARGEPGGGLGIVEGIAERDDDAGAKPFDQSAPRRASVSPVS